MVLSGGTAVGIAPGQCPRRGQALLPLPAPGKHLILNKEAQRGQLLILKYLKTKSFFFLFLFFFLPFLSSLAEGLSVPVLCASQEAGGQEGSWHPWHGKDRGLPLGTSSSDLG